MNLAFHVAKRFGLHLIVSGSIYLLVAFVLAYLHRKFPEPFVKAVKLGLPALLVVLVAFVREPFDVHTGDWWVKSYFDFASWVIGAGGFAYLTYRLFRIWNL